MGIADKFITSRFGLWINSKVGRVFRIFAGLCFLIIGIAFRETPLGILSIIWSFFPLSAGAFDVCYISIVLGGPLQGSKIRKRQLAE